MVAFSLLNAVFMASAIALMVEMLPAFAKNVAHVNEQEVGVIFALEAIGVALFQLPIARRVEGRRRMRGLALMGVIWAGALLGVWAGGAWFSATAAAAVFAATSVAFAVGEGLHGAIHAPLSADLAPPQLVGRYLALASLSWQAGWIVGPAAGGFLLQHAPLALWPAAAGVNLLLRRAGRSRSSGGSRRTCASPRAGSRPSRFRPRSRQAERGNMANMTALSTFDPLSTGAQPAPHPHPSRRVAGRSAGGRRAAAAR